MSRPRSKRPSFGIPFRALLGVFALSGATGLVYEVVWARSLTLVLGSTAYAVSLLLACFMAGLALGAFAFGRWCHRASDPFQLYAYLEIGIGFYALAFPLLILLGDDIYAAIGQAFDPAFEVLLLVRITFAVALFLIPTALMGGTFPVLVQAAVRTKREWTSRIGALYAVNTLGAVGGCVLTGYIALPSLGAQTTSWIAAVVNLSIGIWVLLRRRGAPGLPPVRAEPDSSSDIGTATLPLLFLFGLAGAASLAYEVLWTRLLTPAFHATTYSFTTMLAAFLVGIGIGSAFVGRLADRIRRPLGLLAWIEIAIGISALLSSALLWKRVVTDPWYPFGGWAVSELNKGIWALAVMLVPAVLMGAAFPLAVRSCAGELRTPGRAAGMVYAANTTGAVLGSLTTGFLLIPYFGLGIGILLAAALNLCVGLALLLLADRRRIIGPVLAAGIFAVAIIFYGFRSGSRPPGASGRVLYDREGAFGRAVVVQTGFDVRILTFNSKKEGGTDVALAERAFAHLPLLLGAKPDTVLIIGLGIGATLSAAAAHPVDHIDCIEIAPEIVDAVRFFSDINREVLSDPRVLLRVEDGRNFLLRTPKRYGLILSDIFHPENAGTGNLYTVEHYRLCRRRLAPDGRMAQWIVLSQMAPDEVRSVIGSFTAVFPHVTAWFADLYAASPTLLLLGSPGPQSIRMADLRARLTPDISADLPAAPHATSLLDLFVAGREAVIAYTAGATLNTDDNAYIEFSVPQHTWQEADNALANFTALARLRRPVDPYVEGLTPTDREHLNALRTVSDYVIRGQVLQAHGRLQAAEAAYLRVAEMDPLNPILAPYALDLGDAYRASDDAKGALRLYRWAASIAPENAWAHRGLSMAYLRLGQVDSARIAAERAIYLAPDWPGAYFDLGNVYMESGNAVGARDAYRTALDRQPDYVPALRNLAIVHAMNQNYKAAAQMLCRLLEIVPEDPASRYDLAMSYAMAGKHELARRELRTLLSMSQDTPEAVRARMLLKQLKRIR